MTRSERTSIGFQDRLIRPVAWIFLWIGALAVGQTGAAFAKPTHKAAVTSYYGDSLRQEHRSCNLCHLSDDQIAEAAADELGYEEQPWNAFGRSLAELGERQVDAGAEEPAGILERVRELADADADRDGVANEVEILAGRWPGDSRDRPNEDQLAATADLLASFRRTLPAYPWRPTSRINRPAIPPTAGQWAVNPIDAFVAAEHGRQGLTPQPRASKEILLRRVYLDLIGLPPTRSEIAAFRADESPDAYAKAVDRLLASPQYGERWGRHWMDIWRYSDWAGWGEQVRDSHPHVWRWRDWIVESLNEDKPYDEMVLEMLAADEWKPGDEDALRATGFLVRNYKRLSREQWMLETVDHTSRAFLGVTFRCAQCHDHMYDPLQHEEYFQFRAVFEPYQVRIDPLAGELDTNLVGLSRAYDAEPEAKTLFYLRGDERSPDPDRKIVPGLPEYLGGSPLNAAPISLSPFEYYPSLRPPVLAARRAQARAAIDRQQKALAEAERELADAMALELARCELEAARAELAALEFRIAAEQAKHLPAAGDVDAETIKHLAREASRAERQSKLLAAEVALLKARSALASLAPAAGEAPATESQEATAAKKKLEEAQAARDAAAAAAAAESEEYTPLGEVYPKTSSGRRLALARWIIDRNNPLAARVAVNHLWARHFGRGLVETVDDFGQNGRRPAHPALLDWLAAELMEPSQSIDGESANPQAARPWSMKHIHRLIAMSHTYQMGSGYDAASAAIDPDNRYFWRTTPRRIEAEAVRDSVLHLAGGLDRTQGGPELDHHKAMQIPRRSIYFRHAPEKQTQFLHLFDMAAPTECYLRRDSVIPQQALALANSELTVTQSRRLARTLSQQVEETGDDFLEAAFLQVLGREPGSEEKAECEAFLAQRQKQVAESESSDATNDRDEVHRPAADPRLRARENLVHVLLNHHEFVTLK